jgi:hypothetical protein
VHCQARAASDAVIWDSSIATASVSDFEPATTLL